MFVRLADVQLLVGAAHAAYISRATQVNDPAQLNQLGQHQLVFVPAYQRVKLHGLHLLRGEQRIDKTHAVNVRFLQRETGLEQGVYSGMVTAVLLLDDVRTGDTVHLVYSVEGDNPVFGNRYSTFAGWDDVHPVGLRRVTLIHPAQRRIDWRMLGETKASVEPAISEADGRRSVRFVGRNLRAVEFEPQTPRSHASLRMLQFSEYASWEEVARWALSLFRPAANLPPEANALVERLRALPSREAQVSAALHWVQTEIRYFSISLGESSHRPHSPDIVLQRRYGDCKDKSLLLISVLHHLGVDARAALASASTRNGAAELLPTPLAFDHVVVRVKERDATHFLDPTRLGQSGKLSRMGQPLEGAEVVVAAPDTKGLTKIVTPDIDELVRHDIHERVTLASLAGDGVVELQQTYNGVYAENIRMAMPRLQGEQLRRFAMQGYERRYPDAVLIGEPKIIDDPEINRITVSTRFQAAKIALPHADGWRVPFNAANFTGAFPLPAALRRNFPVWIATHPYHARYLLEIRLPEHVSARREPYERKLETKHFAFRYSTVFRGNHAKYELVLRTRQDTIAAVDLAYVFEEIRKVDRVAGGYVHVGRQDVRTGAALGDTARSTTGRPASDGR